MRPSISRPSLWWGGAAILALLGAPAIGRAADPVGSTDPAFTIIGRDGDRFIQRNGSYYSSQANNYFLWFKPEQMIDEVLQNAKAMGLNTIRLFASCDGDDKDGYCFQGKGTRWSGTVGAGVYDEPTFRKLDYVIARAGELGIRLILPLANQWDDNFGGMRQYVNWLWIADLSQIPADLQQSWLRTVNINDLVSGTPEHALYQRYHDLFYINPTTKAWYRAYVHYVLNRVNTYTGVAYKDDPAILMWELANEPRAHSDPTGQLLQAWIEEMAAFVKQQDPTHLLSTGEEGWYCNPSRRAPPGGEWRYNCELGVDYLRNHQVPEIDACSFHMYPDSYGLTEARARAWIRNHITDCRKHVGKPSYLGEFGWKAYRPEVLYAFTSDTEGWIRDWQVGYAGDPTWVASPALDGGGAIAFQTDQTFRPVTGDGGGARPNNFFHFDPARFDWLSGFVFLPASAPADLSADVYAQTGPDWIWTDSTDVPLAPGAWTQVSLWTWDLANRFDVKKIGIRAKTAGSPYVGPVVYDRIIGMKGWSPSTEQQMEQRAEIYADWGSVLLGRRADGAGFWYLSGIQPDGSPHLDGAGNEVLYPEDEATVQAIRTLAEGMECRSRRPVADPWEGCEQAGFGSPRPAWSDAAGLVLSNEHVGDGQFACRLDYGSAGFAKAYWEFGPVDQNWQGQRRLSVELYSPQSGLSASVVVATGEGWGEWHETAPVPLRPGWNRLSALLTRPVWKTQATGWQHTAAVANLEHVHRVLVGVVGYSAPGAIWLDNIEVRGRQQGGRCR